MSVILGKGVVLMVEVDTAILNPKPPNRDICATSVLFGRREPSASSPVGTITLKAFQFQAGHVVLKVA